MSSELPADIREILTEAADSISVIQETLQGIGFNDYRTDRKKMITVVNSLATLIEMIEKLPEEFKNSNNDIEWKNIEDMRSVLNPDGYGVDEAAVWKEAKQRITKFKKSINQKYFS